jgi:glycosyltransferase involved in cell wall biosynthesis
MGLSALVITLNEEANIRECLEGLKFADEVIVVDCFSTDATVAIARECGARVEQREFKGYSDQRNYSISLATQEWILIVDADERVGAELGAEIRNAAEQAGHDAYRMPRLTEFLGRPMRRCGWYPDYQLRLARKSRVRMPDRLVHETLETDGSVGTLESDLLHFSYRTMEDYSRKMVAYARAAAKQKAADGRKFSWADLAFNPGLTFLKMYIVKGGCLEGIRGLMLSALTAASSALRYAYLWEYTDDKK